MKFEFTPKVLTVEAYGKTFELPKKTPVILGRITEINKALISSDAKGQAETLVKGIGIFIGEDEAKKIYPNIDEADTDEMSAFWLFLNREYSSAANEVVEKYSANRVARRAK